MLLQDSRCEDTEVENYMNVLIFTQIPREMYM